VRDASPPHLAAVPPPPPAHFAALPENKRIEKDGRTANAARRATANGMNNDQFVEAVNSFMSLAVTLRVALSASRVRYSLFVPPVISYSERTSGNRRARIAPIARQSAELA